MDPAPALRSLGGGELSGLAQGPVNAQDPGLQVFPLEGEELTGAHSGVDGEDVEGVEPVRFPVRAGRFGGIQQRPRLLRVEGPRSVKAKARPE